MRHRSVVFALLALLTGGCDGIQSSLDPAGWQAAQIARLYWWMAAGAIVVWLGVVALGLYYGRPHPASPNRRRDRLLIVWAGVALPTLVLTGLLSYGLAMLPPLVARAPEGSLEVQVVGEQWWWRVRYPTARGAIELANEIRLPVGEPVQFVLASDNVIHSFWIPALGGKMDMIPGRATYLTIQPTQTGVFAGACAEYCGTSHAYMRFFVQVVERAEFDEWLRQQAMDAQAPDTMQAERGRQVFAASGCGACHTIRGTAATAVIAPDLTHVGSRLSLAAGMLPNDQQEIRRWIASTERIKPGVHMPAFRMLPSDDLEALGAYLRGLQ